MNSGYCKIYSTTGSRERVSIPQFYIFIEKVRTNQAAAGGSQSFKLFKPAPYLPDASS